MNKHKSTLSMVSAKRAKRASLGDLKAAILAIGAALLVGMNPPAWAGEPVNINHASAEAIAEALQGVGLAKANRIIEYREAHGPFVHIDELAAVQGIGEVTVEKNRDVILLQ